MERPWETVLAVTRPLERPRGNRLPLLLWPVTDVEAGDEAATMEALRALHARGIAAVVTWNHAQAGGLERAVAASRRQADVGMRRCVNANALLRRFCDGSEATAHHAADGSPFFDFSHDGKSPIGCPFALDHRILEVRGRVERHLQACLDAGVSVDIVFADWEIDGPLEWNGAWEAAKRCVRCRARMPDIGDFAAFQAAVRAERSRIQNLAFARPVLQAFPGALVGNYGVYPHGGWRTWWDWYEKPVDSPEATGPIYRADGRGRHRRWVHEYGACGYTMGMPVVYPWMPAYSWHDFRNPDYRWFYAMLRAAGEAADAPEASRTTLVPFVHWKPVEVPGWEARAAPPMGEAAYKELLWHMLLRGHGTFFAWCPAAGTAEEVRPVHEVWAQSLAFADLLEGGTPLAHEAPPEGPEGAVARSTMRSGGRTLCRETRFPVSGAPEGRFVTGTV